jgi:hypothetical protein
MIKIEKILKEYSTKKLKDIIETQSAAYSSDYISYAKDELIKRGDTFKFDKELETTITGMSDSELKLLVEQEWYNYHLEDLEIARKEYLKRGFENVYVEEEGDLVSDKRYPALRTISKIYFGTAVVIGIVSLIVLFFASNKPLGLEIILATLIVISLIVLGLIGMSESIKIIIDIEENTRENNE